MAGEEPDATQSATQDWEHPLLWAALGGEPDTDFVEGIAIVSHPNGPELAIARALQQRRTAQATPIPYATPDVTGDFANSGSKKQEYSIDQNTLSGTESLTRVPKSVSTEQTAIHALV